MTSESGKRNQKRPLKMLCVKELTWTTVITMETTVHASWPTWYL